MYAAGATPTTVKTLSYQLTETVDRAAWPARWRERLAARPELFPPPEDLPRGPPQQRPHDPGAEAPGRTDDLRSL